MDYRKLAPAASGSSKVSSRTPCFWTQLHTRKRQQPWLHGSLQSEILLGKNEFLKDHFSLVQMGCTQDPQGPILVRADIWPITKFVKNSDLENLLNIGMKREKFPMLTAVTNGLDTIISIRFSTKSRFIFLSRTYITYIKSDHC